MPALREHLRRAPSGNESIWATEYEMRTLSDAELITSPPLVMCYSLKVNDWGLVLVDKIEDIDWDANAFSELILDRYKKEILMGVIAGYSKVPSQVGGFTYSRRKGLVFMLSGPPGCGKTLTAGKINSS
jgi:hypothetical protein